MHKVNVAKAIATLALLAFVAAFASTLRVRAAADETYDITILNGRVMDPESGLDAIRNVGIRAGKIAAISATPLNAKSTIDDFKRTRDDLRGRYEQLRGIDASAQNGAAGQIASLAKKRADLYAQMVAQIGREVRLLAQARGISVVVTDPVANAGGVDLTSDALKDIESLHE